MPSFRRSALILVVLAAFARADETPPAVTYLGSHLLPRTDLAVRGEAADSARVGGGIPVLTFRILETLYGREKRSRVLLLSSDPGFFPPKEVPAILFLRRLGEGRYEPLARMDLVGKEAGTRLEILKRYLELEALPDLAAKRTALHDLLLENLASDDPFRTASAIRELAHFTVRYADAFTPEEVRTIRARLATTRDPVLKDLIATTLENLGPAPAPAKGEEPEKPAAPPKRRIPPPREFRELLAAWRKKPARAAERLAIVRAVCSRHLKHAAPILLEALSDASAAVREQAALSLGEAEVQEAVDPLLDVLAREKDRDVLAAAIQALGILGPPRALETVLTFGRDPDLLRPVAFAAARIGGDVAREYIRGLKATHTGSGEADRKVRELSDFLLSDDFAKQEAALAKIRRRRLR